jgi:RNA polymerase sigma-70 factor (ECF subfamily)
VSDGKLVPFRRVRGTTDELSDRALVSAVAEGDKAALGALYDRFHRDVFRFVAHLIRRDSLVDDFVQNTFLEAYRSAPRFRGESALKTWLFGIAANLVRQHRRAEVRREKANVALASVPRATAPSPSEAITLEQQRQLLAAAIETLTPALREIYVLCVIEEMPGKEAAVVLGVREASVWRRLSDAREALRNAIRGLQE